MCLLSPSLPLPPEGTHYKGSDSENYSLLLSIFSSSWHSSLDMLNKETPNCVPQQCFPLHVCISDEFETYRLIGFQNRQGT